MQVESVTTIECNFKTLLWYSLELKKETDEDKFYNFLFFLFCMCGI